MSKLPQRHQTLLFSATMPKEIELLAQAYLTKPLTVKVGGGGGLPLRCGGSDGGAGLLRWGVYAGPGRVRLQLQLLRAIAGPGRVRCLCTRLMLCMREGPPSPTHPTLTAHLWELVGAGSHNCGSLPPDEPEECGGRSGMQVLEARAARTRALLLHVGAVRVHTGIFSKRQEPWTAPPGVAHTSPPARPRLGPLAGGGCEHAHRQRGADGGEVRGGRQQAGAPGG